MASIDFNRLSKTNIGIAIWWYEDQLAVTINVGNKGTHCNFDSDESFYPDFIQMIDKVMNISSFVLTLYSNEGNIQHITTTTEVFVDRVKKWKSKHNKLPQFKDIEKVLK